MKYTADQQRVIDTRDSNILVSAAAGSGKTAVLVERIIQRIMDREKPVDIDRLLIVTFTSAAAAQMRERISRAVAKGLEENPENEHLQRQASLIHNAQITTIDSFCLFVIRNNFNEIGIDPGFRVADESEIKMLEADVMDRLLEQMHTEPSERFLHFVECYSTGTSEKRIEEAILRLYHFSMSYPFPEEWLQARMEDYQAGGAQELSTKRWFQEALQYIDTILTECAQRLRQAIAISERPGGPAQYIDNLFSDLELIENLKNTKDYEALHDLFTYCSFTRLSAKKTQGEDPVLKETVKGIRDEVKKNIGNLKKMLFQISVEDTLRDMAVCQEAVEELVQLTLSFKEMLDLAKREKNIIDFSDMEHFALQILLEKNERGDIVPRETALALQDYFEEVMIDEYQDSNEVQELLLKSISGEAKGRYNRFMVGDVKQSIYKFRLARPEIFMEKYDTYVIHKEAVERGANCVRIDLSMNFRSRREVTDAVNFICGQLMRKSVGNVEYDQNAALYVGASYPEAKQNMDENPYQTELLIASPAKEDTEDVQYSPKEREALLVAERIKKLVGRFPVTDEETGKLRPAKYSDIVILFRATSGWDEDFRKILSENKIPVHVTSKTGYFETIEIQGIVNFLRILDNPLQDIAFFGAMRLPFFDFSEEEIVRIRCFAKGQQFLYEQVKYYYENAGQSDPLQEKLKRLFSMLSDYRKRVVYTPIKELIRALIDETGYGAYIGSMPGGDQRLANLELLLEKAGTFQNTSFYGLFHFIRYLETVQEQEVDFGEANILDENADVVRIMTIHKSKGLEFPICFVCGLSKQFNMLDMRQAILMDVELGVGVAYIDPEMRVKRKNMRKNVVAQRMKEDTRGEDLRVLYVALTRAKEKLILTGYLENFAQKLKANLYLLYLTMEEEEKIPYSAIMSAGSYMDLIIASLMRHECMKPFLEEQGIVFYAHELLYGDVPIKAALCTELFDFREELASQGKSALLEQELDRADILADQELKARIKSRLDFPYPYAYLEGLTVKTTVSELKKESYKEELENAAQLIALKEETYVPKFARKLDVTVDGEAERGGVQYGTVVHKVMELLSFGKDFRYQSGADDKRIYAVLNEERRRWISEGRVTEEELSYVPIGRIWTFLKSPLAERMCAAKERGELYKEQPFVLGVEASQLSERYPKEELVLIQGVIDVFFYEEDGIVLADYKTDRVENEKQLADRYRAQLDYYQRALEQITGKQVKERYLYSFCLQKEIQL